ncbi:MAG: RNA polymerase sigma factor [Lachnospiraceae bacterium]|nr:RNA polymerase sigma factor [Lachnospiraceae bacterium]MBP3610836.1 RNA polymerase sigma factor [Lachnospiraceae bacterium]
MIEELYKKYHQELISWCHNMTGNLHTAEELVQEAFLRAMLHEEVLAVLQEQQCRSWLYRTIKNLYVDCIRHRSKETIVEEFPQRQKYPEEMSRLEWEQLLETLPDLEGVIFTLRYLEGYNSKQIGEILSLPPGTVRFKLSSARQHLKEALGGQKYV